MTVVLAGTAPTVPIGAVPALLEEDFLGFASGADVETARGRIAATHGVDLSGNWELPNALAPHGAHRTPDAMFYGLRFSPGTVGVRTRQAKPYDPPPAEVLQLHTLDGSPVFNDDGSMAMVNEEFERPKPVRGVIKEWSRKSRARMVERIGELDLSDWGEGPGDFALCTLTLPGQWQDVAKDAREFKTKVRKFRARWERAIGPWVVLWKIEAQRRGAPHWHGLMRVPAKVGAENFEDWYARVWAEVCGASDECHRCGGFDARAIPESSGPRMAPGVFDCECRTTDSERSRQQLRHGPGTKAVSMSSKMTDPRRIAIYFSKHSLKSDGGKEYQNRVPDEWGEAGAGRFWGVSGLKRAVGEVWLTRSDFYRARRYMRGVKRGLAASVEMSRARASGASVVNLRVPRSSTSSLRNAGGWLLVNDGVGLGYALSRALALGYP